MKWTMIDNIKRMEKAAQAAMPAPAPTSGPLKQPGKVNPAQVRQDVLGAAAPRPAPVAMPPPSPASVPPPPPAGPNPTNLEAQGAPAQGAQPQGEAAPKKDPKVLSAEAAEATRQKEQDNLRKATVATGKAQMQAEAAQKAAEIRARDEQLNAEKAKLQAELASNDQEAAQKSVQLSEQAAADMQQMLEQSGDSPAMSNATNPLMKAASFLPKNHVGGMMLEKKANGFTELMKFLGTAAKQGVKNRTVPLWRQGSGNALLRSTEKGTEWANRANGLTAEAMAGSKMPFLQAAADKALKNQGAADKETQSLLATGGPIQQQTSREILNNLGLLTSKDDQLKLLANAEGPSVTMPGFSEFMKRNLPSVNIGQVKTKLEQAKGFKETSKEVALTPFRLGRAALNPARNPIMVGGTAAYLALPKHGDAPAAGDVKAKDADKKEGSGKDVAAKAGKGGGETKGEDPLLYGGLGALAGGGLAALMTPKKQERLRGLLAMLGAAGGGLAGALYADAGRK